MLRHPGDRLRRPVAHLDPDVALFGFLRPLLQALAVPHLLVEFKANLQAFLLMSVGCVSGVAQPQLRTWCLRHMTAARDPALGPRRSGFRRARLTAEVALLAAGAVVTIELVSGVGGSGHRARNVAMTTSSASAPPSAAPSLVSQTATSAPLESSIPPARSTAAVGFNGIDGSPARDARIFPNGRGYATTARQERWTDDGGVSWREISPPGLFSRPASLGAVDPEAIATTADGHQWAAYVTSNVSRSVTVVRRPDVRGPWTRSAVPIGDLAFDRSGSLMARLSFIDDRTGWLLVVETSTHEFPSELFGTTDGGRSWLRFANRMPSAGASVFRFVTPSVGYLGWTWNGWNWITRDGGRHWTRFSPPTSAAPETGNTSGIEPTVDDLQADGDALLLKASYPVGPEGASYLVEFFRSTDVGRHWFRITSFAAGGNDSASLAVDPTTRRFAILRSGPGPVWTLSQWTGTVEITSARSRPGLATGMLSMADPRHFWVVADDGRALLATADDAETWHHLA